MTHFLVNDIPAEDVVLEPALELDAFTSVTVELLDPDGAPVTDDELTAVIAGEEIHVTFPTTATVLTKEGLYVLRFKLAKTAGGEQRWVHFIPVEEYKGWATIDFARDPDAGGWREAENIGAVKLWRLLQIARHQVLEYAPERDAAAPIPPSYMEAQLMQARNLWNAGRVSPSGEAGGDDFAITPFPLDWQVKNLIRPKRAMPVIG